MASDNASARPSARVHTRQIDAVRRPEGIGAGGGRDEVAEAGGVHRIVAQPLRGEEEPLEHGERSLQAVVDDRGIVATELDVVEHLVDHVLLGDGHEQQRLLPPVGNARLDEPFDDGEPFLRRPFAQVVLGLLLGLTVRTDADAAPPPAASIGSISSSTVDS